MGIQIIQKSNLSLPKGRCKTALVLAGGAVSGGAFKVGGLIALNSLLTTRKVTDFDVYVGVSVGAFLAAPLSAGSTPEELYRSLSGNSTKIKQLSPLDFYYPNFREFISKPLKCLRDISIFWPRIAATLIRYFPSHKDLILSRLKNVIRNPTYQAMEDLLLPLIREILETVDLPEALSYIPSGMFDNARLERYVRENLERNRLPNNFRHLKLDKGKELYISATNLNTAQRVVFGHDTDNSVTISQAVQASTAIPGYYRPARINGIDYIDGAVRKTADIEVAIEKGCDLIIVYNPFRPFYNFFSHRLSRTHRSIADLGVTTIINQTFRTLLHSRMMYALDQLRMDPAFKGDVIVIEPTETDAEFFEINPLAFWRRTQAAKAGFRSVKESMEKQYPRVKQILQAYGFETDIEKLNTSLEIIERSAEDDDTVLENLDNLPPASSGKVLKLRIVK